MTIRVIIEGAGAAAAADELLANPDIIGEITELPAIPGHKDLVTTIGIVVTIAGIVVSAGDVTARILEWQERRRRPSEPNVIFVYVDTRTGRSLTDPGPETLPRFLERGLELTDGESGAAPPDVPER